MYVNELGVCMYLDVIWIFGAEAGRIGNARALGFVLA